MDESPRCLDAGEGGGRPGSGRAGPSAESELTPQKRWLWLWSHGIYYLGLTEQQFLRLAPFQFDHLHKRWKQEQDRQYYRAGLIASVAANFSIAPPKEPVKATDFIPGYKEPELTDEQVLDRL